MDKEARRALLVAKNLLPERPVEAHPAFSSYFARRGASSPDEYGGPSDSRLKVWANRPDPITRADHILDGNTVTTPEDEVLRFPTREHAVDYIDSMVGHWPRYSKGGSAGLSKWLGASKVVDEAGKPLVAYKAMRGTVPRMNSETGLTHVALDPDVAKEFSNGGKRPVHQVHVMAENPFDFRNSEHIKWLVGEVKKNPDILKQFNAYNMTGPDDFEADERFLTGALKDGAYQAYETPVITNLIRNKGHDGIYMTEEGERHRQPNLGLFRPHQIKSATDNNGNYDPTDPDITKARGGSIHPATQIPGVHISERIHGKPIFTEERIGKEGGGLLTGKDQTQDDEGIIAYQGGPHSVGPEGYSNDKIGTGEGAQVYGHGHYFAEAEPVAREYRNKLSAGIIKSKTGASWDKTQSYLMPKEMASVLPEHLRENTGVLYPVDFGLNQIRDGMSVDDAISSMRHNYSHFNPEHVDAAESVLRHHAPEVESRGHMHQVLIKGKPEHFLDWDALLDEQSPHVMKALEAQEWWPGMRDAAEDRAFNRGQNPIGGDLMRELHVDWEKPEAAEMLARAGIRGIRFLDQVSRKKGEGTRNYVVFDPKHIDIQRRYARGGMAYGDGGSTPDAGVQKALDLTRDLNPQGLYSHAAEAALASPQAKGPLPQMLASLKGVKPDELKYSGVQQAFAGQPKVTRDELAQHFQKGLPDIQETSFDDQGGIARETKYGQYTIPGGKNYREVLLHLPSEQSKIKKRYSVRTFLPTQHDNLEEARQAHDNIMGIRGERPDLQERMDEFPNDIVDNNPRHLYGQENFRHSHWPVPNVFAHIRFKDRTGPNGEKILHVEEVQSDWGQHARKAGTYDPAKPFEVFETTSGKVLSSHASEEEAQAESAKHRSAGQEGVDYGHVMDKSRDQRPAPDAPYIGNTQNWTDLALKRVLYEAAAGGYDKIIWTPGAEQAKRYSLSNHVDELRYTKNGDGTYNVIPFKEQRALNNIKRDNIPEKELDALFGQDVASKMRGHEGDANGEFRSLSGQDLEVGGEGMKGYYDKVVPKSLLTLAKQHDPEAKLGEEQVNAGREKDLYDRYAAQHLMPPGPGIYEANGLIRPVGQEWAVYTPYGETMGQFPDRDYAEQLIRSHIRFMLGNPDRPTKTDRIVAMPALDVTPRMRESIPKRGFKAYARGGEVEGFKYGGSPEDDLVRQRLEAMPSITSPDPEVVKRALAIAAQSHAVIPNFNSDKMGNTYYNFKTPTDIDAVQATVGAIPGVTPLTTKDMSWEDLYKEGKGGTMINLGGDRSRLGRLTHIQGKALAWPVDLHAGPDYMREPNAGAVWANASAHAGSIKRLIGELQEKGPVYGAYTPMGPKTLDSSAQMSDALMSQIATQKLDPKMAEKFDDEIRRGMFAETDKRAKASKHMEGWPGIEDALAARDFLLKKPGSIRSLIVKHMDKKMWHDGGFPHVGITRVALTDPALLKAGGNMVGHRVARLSPDDITPGSFQHNTYPVATAGEYVGDVPLVQRHYAFPETIRQFALEPKVPGVLHPYSENPNARNGFRKNTEDQRITQTLDEPWLESLSKGLENQKKYGFSRGGDTKRHGKAGGGSEGEMAGDKFASYKDPTGTPIDDWKWRDLPAVRAELGNITEIPSHVADFGRFMDETAKRAATQGLKPRDLVKSYAITLASIQRRAQDVDRIRAAGMPLEGLTGKIRPEGAMGEWLQTPAGQAYLDRAVRGEVHEPALDDMVQKLKPFGMAPKLADSLRWAAANLPGKEGLVSHLVAAGMEQASSPDEWRDFAKGLHGIDVSKAGFIASMLGRGDQPTFDARQRILQTGMTSTDAGKMIAGPKMNPKARAGVDRLAARQSAMDLALPKELAPYYQHLAHHTIWDKASGEETTHQDLMDAMRHAASGGAIEKSPIHDHPLVHVMRGLGFPGLEETGKASNNNRSVVDEALRLTSQNGSPLPDAVNLARQHKPGRR